MGYMLSSRPAWDIYSLMKIKVSRKKTWRDISVKRIYK
jgi:hypothetical protein